MRDQPANRKPWTARNVDPAMLALVAANVLMALLIGQHGGELALALQASLGMAAVAGVAVVRYRGQVLSRTLVTLVLGGLVALQIHLARGALEFHFNVFVTMGLVLAWRDWRPVALLTGFYALHHIGFDRMLAAGLGTYCLSAPDPLRIALHIGFVAVMGVVLSYVAWRQGREAEESRELAFLVRAMGQDGPIRLRLDMVRSVTPAGQRLQLVQQRMAEAIGLVRDAAQSVRLASEHAAAGSAELMERTHTTAAGLKDAAMCLAQIGVIVSNSNQAADEAKGLSHQATTMADEGGRMVADVVESMQQIERSSKRIGDIVGVIDGIAFQTNILALNAAVEAARAGEQGRGFAVVAAEVRSLAQRSAAAAREIKGLIAASETTVAHGAGLVAGTGQRMQSLVQTVRHVGGLFDTITADASDHAQGLQMVTQSVDGLGTMTQDNTTLAERTGVTAQVLQQQVARLDEVLGGFNIGQAPDSSVQQAALQALLSQAAAARPAASGRVAETSSVDFF
jgi:methyl-accepting chemotaxis protein